MKTALNHKIFLRILLSILLAVGGAQGIWLTIPAALTFAGTFWLFVIVAFFLTFYAMNLVAIYYLWRKPLLGLAMVSVLFCLQVPQIESHTLSYRLASASGCWIQATPTGTQVDTNWTSCYSFKRKTGWGPDFVTAGPKTYGVNIFAAAIAAISFAARRWKRVPFYHGAE